MVKGLGALLCLLMVATLAYAQAPPAPKPPAPVVSPPAPGPAPMDWSTHLLLSLAANLPAFLTALAVFLKAMQNTAQIEANKVKMETMHDQLVGRAPRIFDSSTKGTPPP